MDRHSITESHRTRGCAGAAPVFIGVIALVASTGCSGETGGAAGSSSTGATDAATAGAGTTTGTATTGTAAGTTTSDTTPGVEQQTPDATTADPVTLPGTGDSTATTTPDPTTPDTTTATTTPDTTAPDGTNSDTTPDTTATDTTTPAEATGPVTCSEAAGAYTIQTSVFEGVNAGGALGGFDAGRLTTLPIAVGASGATYVGFNSDAGAGVAAPSGTLVTESGARIAGVTATNDGFAALLFDDVDEMWAMVKRYAADGQELFATDLFRSPNLDDEGTKGESSTSRLGYLSATDELVAYFAHTQRYDDGVRHQGGYLATISAAGEQTLFNGWFGSHNLDQRLWVNDSTAAVIGLGDAYPIGIFFSMLEDRARPSVIYRLAAAGNGTANGQLGGLLEIGGELVAPFITNLSVSPDIDAGTWPDIDESVSSQIRDAAANGVDMGLLRIPMGSALPDPDVPTVWLEPGLSDGARLEQLKSARYGTGNLVLLLWAEAMGSNRNSSSTFFSMVVDPEGAVCQPKTALDAALSPSQGDDIVRGPDGSIHWANSEAGSVTLVTLVPGE